MKGEVTRLWSEVKRERSSRALDLSPPVWHAIFQANCLVFRELAQVSRRPVSPYEERTITTADEALQSLFEVYYFYALPYSL